MASNRRTVVIIGAGVAGLCTAYYAAQRGHDVTVLERMGPEYRGTSYGNAGMIVPSHFTPLAAPGVLEQGLRWMFDSQGPFRVKPRPSLSLLRWAWHFWRASTASRARSASPVLAKLNLASRRCYEELAEEHGNSFELSRTGLLMMCRTHDGMADEIHQGKTARSLGLEAQVLSTSEVQEMIPAASSDVVGGVYYPDDARIHPSRFMASLRGWLENRVEFVWNTPVIGWRRNGSRVSAVETVSCITPADTFILCAGSWTPHVLRPLGVFTPIEPGAGYSVTLPGNTHDVGVPTILTEARVAVTPFEDALRIGGTLQLGGMQEQVDAQRVRAVLRSTSGYLPGLDPSLYDDAPRWVGLRPCTPDGLPLVGRVRPFQNLFVGAGHAMLGMSMGPITGKLLAELASEEPNSLPIELLDPNRFSMRTPAS